MRLMISRMISVAVFLFVVVPTVSFAQSAYDRALESAGNGDYATAVIHIREAMKGSPNEETIGLAANIYLELESFDTAVVYAKRLYEEDDDNAAYVRLYAKTLVAAQRAPEAVTILRKQIKKEPDVNSYLVLVDALLGADSVSAAELVATTAKQKFSKEANAYLALGNLYFNYKPQPVLELAVKNYEEALKLEPALVQAHFNLAQSYWKMANRESDEDLGNELFKRSLQEWNEVSQLDPSNARAWFEQGKIFYLAKRYGDAAKALTEYRKLRPVGTGNPLASWYLGKSFYEMRLCDSARVHLDDAAAQVDSVRPLATLYMARCFIFTKDFKGATEKYAATNPTVMEGSDYWYQGSALVLTGDTVGAMTAMDKGVELDPSQCALMFRYGALLSSKAMYTKSSSVFRKRLESCSDSLDARVLAFIGNNFFADSLVDSAEAYYRKAVLKDSVNPYFINRLAEVATIKGDAQGAKALYEKAITLGTISEAQADKVQAEVALGKLAGIGLQEKDWSGIIGTSKRLVTLNPKSLLGWIYLGVGHQGSSNKDEACKAYREALKIDPNNKTAKDNLKGLGC